MSDPALQVAQSGKACAQRTRSKILTSYAEDPPLSSADDIGYNPIYSNRNTARPRWRPSSNGAWDCSHLAFQLTASGNDAHLGWSSSFTYLTGVGSLYAVPSSLQYHTYHVLNTMKYAIPASCGRSPEIMLIYTCCCSLADWGIVFLYLPLEIPQRSFLQAAGPDAHREYAS